MKDLDYKTKDGGKLSVLLDETWKLQWHSLYPGAFAVADNTPALRQFLRRTLERLEKDARKGKK